MPFFNLPSGGGEGLPVLTGDGPPSDLVGSNGQLYIDTLNGALYVKAAGTWGSGIDVGGAADWTELTGKPAEFPPEAHTHPWAEITATPATFPPDAHFHVVADVSGLQDALDGKQPAGSYASATHTHVAADISDLATSVVTSVNGQTGAVTITTDAPASSWEEITNKPTAFPPEAHTHPWAEITDAPLAFPPESHAHEVADVTNLQTILDGKADDSHSHVVADISDLSTALDAKADASHTHQWADITDTPATFPPDTHSHDVADVVNLQTLLDGKADDSHSHTAADISDLASAVVTSVNSQTGDVVVDPPTPLSDDAASPLGVAGSGIAAAASRADHTHPMPTASDVGALAAWSPTPTSATSPAAAGDIARDENYIYVAVGADSWRRIPLEQWLSAPAAPSALSVAVSDEPEWSIAGFQQLQSNPFSVSGLDCLQFSEDGLTLISSNSGYIQQYALAAPWQISGATLESQLQIDTVNSGLIFESCDISQDGLQLYLMQRADVKRIQRYVLSTAWDLSTATYADSLNLADNAEYTSVAPLQIPRCARISKNGTRLFHLDYTRLFVHYLRQPWLADMSNVLGTQSVALSGFRFAFDYSGNSLFVLRPANDQLELLHYDLASAFDTMGGLSLVTTFVVNAAENFGESFAFKRDGSRFFLSSQNDQSIYEFGAP